MTKKQRKEFLSAIILAVFLLLLALYYFSVPPFDFDLGIGFKANQAQPTKKPIVIAEGALCVHFIDVGQGDCILVTLPDGKNMMIDGGKRDSKITATILDYLEEYGIERLDYVMLTHADEDHCGSLDDVIKSDVACDEFYMPYLVASKAQNDPIANGNAIVPQEISDAIATPCEIDTDVFASFVDAMTTEEGFAYEKVHYSLSGMTIEGEGYTFTLLSPSALFYKKVTDSNAKNNLSPIMILEFNGKRVMFTGDAEGIAETYVLDSYVANGFSDIIDVDVLKVGHHGSYSSCSQGFLNIIKPEYAVISVGEGNTYKHPHSQPLQRLAAMSITTYRTDHNGDIRLLIEGEGMTFDLQKTEVSFVELYKRVA
ncbi:MAG: ComEC/Rec2 family competence protein [Clostridia bacterium]|nr:ComEC/Rec2 family competence protein [Clostridia bacterium]